LRTLGVLAQHAESARHRVSEGNTAKRWFVSTARRLHYVDRMSFYTSPIEQRSGGSLPSTSGFHVDPIEQRSGGSLPSTSFHVDPIEQHSGGSLPSTSGYGRSVPAAPASGLSSIYDMFFGGD
jgi:hypothetical protein